MTPMMYIFCCLLARSGGNRVESDVLNPREVEPWISWTIPFGPRSWRHWGLTAHGHIVGLLVGLIIHKSRIVSKMQTSATGSREIWMLMPDVTWECWIKISDRGGVLTCLHHVGYEHAALYTIMLNLEPRLPPLSSKSNCPTLAEAHTGLLQRKTSCWNNGHNIPQCEYTY